MAKRNSKKKQNTKTKIFEFIAVLLIFALAFGAYYFLNQNNKNIDIAELGVLPNKITQKSGDLQVHFISVGQGDSIVISFPDGKHMIIDGADRFEANHNMLFNYLKRIDNLKGFDYMMLTHPDSDHVGSLDDVLDSYEIKNIYLPNLLPSYGGKSCKNEYGAKIGDYQTVKSYEYYDFYETAMSETYENGKEAKKYENVNQLSIDGDNYSLDIYCVSNEYYKKIKDGSKKINGVSPICILSYKGRKVVFTGDATFEAENIFMKNKGTAVDCDVLKVGHHGSDTSTSETFLSFIDPEYSVISCGKNNKFHHPCDSTLKKLHKYGNTIYRTDLNGNIMLTINSNGDMNFQMDNIAS